MSLTFSCHGHTHYVTVGTNGNLCGALHIISDFVLLLLFESLQSGILLSFILLFQVPMDSLLQVTDQHLPI